MVVNPGDHAEAYAGGGVRLVPEGGGAVSAAGEPSGRLVRTSVQQVTLGAREAALLLAR